MNNSTFTKKQLRNTPDRLFYFCVALIAVLAVVLVAYPLYFVVIASFSNSNLVNQGKVLFWIRDFNTYGYEQIFSDSRIWTGYRNTIFYSILGTLINLAVTLPAAYVLSRKGFGVVKILMPLFVFTMYFSGGMIPSYLNIKSLGLLDTFWVLVFPTVLSTYNMILMKSFFQSMPRELEESAYVDGANDLVVLIKIVLPLSKAMLATIALFYAVSRWNGFMDAILYINDESMYTIQLRLRQLIQSSQVSSMMEEIPEMKDDLVAETIKAGCMVFSMIPVMIIYPWLQKYFVKGVMIGSVKG